ncbi:MAG: hypothetical protein A2087_09355 [Spirochaetes bacterium GWD1_61_31]|nr:MAG: hypothetical protein A2Y37_13900 [Spirochaetes bacterium GWB1_60_80]OHD28438.1 MAG: hypothetical protein A2004_08100 [Spirochaetes bacterium GWC1_61_12]OHD40287.1 MAG: hypothetical protein A2087_09355 [Spirochaetes bacterium GWD1_61_31]OHD44836.1 MAG: hypothetical protein A2Y35_00465 [Spirochaetes bacterium GWE1_60_18]OHD59950.1 MAG: hypothetical protein A2Y32_04720 [Spirochaetes bacterium GWF1_60_12]HAP44067.1 tRNA threonylcarbamoyladenosine dehydratase [Spirochaetaceae bacterium]
MSFKDRSRIIFGDANLTRLEDTTICVAGLGGVGAAAAMDLVRCGVGRLAVIDFDAVQESNLNRLYFGYLDTVGLAKTAAFAAYARRVNPAIKVIEYSGLLRGAQIGDILPADCDYYLDCIDTLNSKVNLIGELVRHHYPFTSSMGTAGRLRPERLQVGSLWQVHHCSLAAKVRSRLRRLGIGEADAITCVWSDEPAVAPAAPEDGSIPGTIAGLGRVRAVQGSAPFVPQAAGHILASLAVRAMLES